MRSRRSLKGKARLAFCDIRGNVYEHPGYEPAFRTGRHFVRVDACDLIQLPYGSVLFSMPGRLPVYYDRGSDGYHAVASSPDGDDIWAASSFLSSGYLRTYLPAFEKRADAPVLPLWAYTGVVFINGEFYAPAVRIDDDPRSDPEIHQNDDELRKSIRALKRQYPENRLVRQLSVCSTEYRCLCARNFFLGRYEAPVPTSPSCNANCLGCLSYQDGSGFCPSQYRLEFSPTPEEIAEVILHHVGRVERSVASFGQGCEGEPLLRGKDLTRAVGLVRKKTSRGTININTNASRPLMVKELIAAGIDSIRVSLNSPTERYYMRYYRPNNYSFRDVEKSLETALNAGIFVSINLFFLPGFTDMESEVRSLFDFLDRFPVNMLQARNLNMDPDYYLDRIGCDMTGDIGVTALIAMLRERYPSMKIGYYNPPKEDFAPSNA